jgi:hypothetical protein
MDRLVLPCTREQREADMEDGERIARVEVGMEAQTGQLDRIERDLASLRVGQEKLRDRVERLHDQNEKLSKDFDQLREHVDQKFDQDQTHTEYNLTEIRRENSTNMRWIITLMLTFGTATVGLLINLLVRLPPP